MKLSKPNHNAPDDADERFGVKPVICYPIDSLEPAPLENYFAAKKSMKKISETLVPARDAKCVEVKQGQFFRIVSVDGPQVGDLNLHSLSDPSERFFSGKTRALHGTHVSTGDRMWSSLPFLRPMATITDDTLDWYGFDEFGGSVHDVIGTRCDPYTHMLTSDDPYHYCCHSNLTRSLADYLKIPRGEAELLVHDVCNIFMCTGFTKDTHQYFMKATPVRPDDYIEFFAEIDLIVNLSACPGGDCSTSHSSDEASCYPLRIDVYEASVPKGWSPSPINPYDQSHG